MKARFEHEEAFWKQHFDAEDTLTTLPYGKYSRNTMKTGTHSIYATLPSTLSQRMISIARGSHMTLFILLLAGIECLLQKYTNEKRMILGIPIIQKENSTRRMVNQVVMLKNEVSREDTYKTLLTGIKQSLEESLKHQNLPFLKMVQNLDIQYDVSGLPIVNTIVCLKQLHTDDFNKNIVSDIQFEFDLEDQAIHVHVRYDQTRYDQEFIEQTLQHLEEVFNGVLYNPEFPIHKLNILTEREQEQLIDDFNSTSGDGVYPKEKTIYQLFEEQVERTPDRIAVVFEEQQLTYRELNKRANQLARHLREQGIQAEELVGIMVERSLEMVVAVLGVLKAGGAYVPIDPEYPEERIHYMLENSGTRFLLTQGSLAKTINTNVEAYILLMDDASLYQGDSSNLAPIARPENLAYVIYTSGTTGKAKGVMIEHHSYISTMHAYQEAYRLGGDSFNLAQLASFSFDVFAGDMARALPNGGTIFICPKEIRIDPVGLAKYIEKHRINIFESTPALIIPLMQYVYDNQIDVSSLELLITSSDSCSVEEYRKLQERFGDRIRIINSYGVTEVSIDSSYYEEPLSKLPLSGSVPIGKPILNHKFYILDDNREVVPIGIPGELCIGGAGVARGYLNREELTAEKFVPNPFVAGERIYRTGDLARWMPDGNVDYIGRMDHQVKIRGYRIELGEVEAQLLKIEAVQEAIVMARDDEFGEKQLCAYFVAKHELSIKQLREVLAERLPNFMVPAYFVSLERMPLTPNGKIDRKALPAPQEQAQGYNEYVAPRTEIERQLLTIWQEVLGIQKIGIKDNFFAQGGHSLRAATLVLQIHKTMNIDLPLRIVFQSPTIEQMAEEMERMQKGSYVSIPVIEDREYYPVSSAQKRLFVLSQLEGSDLIYNMPDTMMIEGVLQKDQLELAFQKLIERHQTLRTGFELIDGETMQRVYAEVPFTLEYVYAMEAEVEEIILRFVRSFNLNEPPLIRAGLIELAPEKHVMILDMHHIISDGVSSNLLIEELIQLYEGKELPPLRIQYKDYAVWQQSEAQKEKIKQQEAYWLNVFSGELPILNLPTDYARSNVQSFHGDLFEFDLPLDMTEGLKKIAAETGSTLYMVILASFTTLLHKYSGQEDMIIGTLGTGRTHADLEPLIGMFVNTLAIRSYPAKEKSFQAYLEEVKESVLHATENQDFPFEELVKKVELKRDVSRNPLFDVMFVYENIENNHDETLDSLKLAPYNIERALATTKFDLTLAISVENNVTKAQFEYSTKLFTENTIANLSAYMLSTLKQICEGPSIHLKDITFTTSQTDEESSIEEIELIF